MQFSDIVGAGKIPSSSNLNTTSLNNSKVKPPKVIDYDITKFIAGWSKNFEESYKKHILNNFTALKDLKVDQKLYSNVLNHKIGSMEAKTKDNISYFDRFLSYVRMSGGPIANLTKGAKLSLPIIGNVPIQPFSYELTDFEKDIDFVDHFFDEVILKPEETKQYITTLNTARIQLENLSKTYENEGKLERVKTVGHISEKIKRIINTIEKNSYLKFNRTEQFVLNLYNDVVKTDKSDLQKRRELKNQLRDIYKFLTETPNITINPSTHFTMKYFNDLVEVLNSPLALEPTHLLSLLTECFLLKEKDVERFDALLKGLKDQKAEAKSFKANLQVINNINIWINSGLFPITFEVYKNSAKKGVVENLSVKNPLLVELPLAKDEKVVEQEKIKVIKNGAEKLAEMPKLDSLAQSGFVLQGKMIESGDKKVLSFESSNANISYFTGIKLTQDKQNVELTYFYKDEARARHALIYVNVVNRVMSAEIKKGEGNTYCLSFRNSDDIKNLFNNTLISYIGNLREEAWKMVNS